MVARADPECSPPKRAPDRVHLLPRAAYTRPVWAAALRLGYLVAMLSCATAAARTPRRHQGPAPAPRERLAALGASILVAGPVWGLALGWHLTRALRRRYVHARARALPDDTHTLVLATRMRTRRSTSGTLCLGTRCVRFVPDDDGEDTLEFPLEALRSATPTVLRRHWTAELLGAGSQGLVVTLPDGALERFVLPRPRALLERVGE